MYKSNDFYVQLMSNDSTFNHPENTQSAFTNDMHSYINLNPEEWAVGVIDISFNSFKYEEKSGEQQQRSKRAISANPDTGVVKDEEEVLYAMLSNVEFKITKSELDKLVVSHSSLYFADFLALLGAKMEHSGISHLSFEKLKEYLLEHLRNEIPTELVVPFSQMGPSGYRLYAPSMYHVEKDGGVYTENEMTFFEFGRIRITDLFLSLFYQMPLLKRNWDEFIFTVDLFLEKPPTVIPPILSRPRKEAPLSKMLVIDLGENSEHLMFSYNSIKDLKAADNKLYLEHLLERLSYNTYPASNDFRLEVKERLKDFIKNSKLNQPYVDLDFNTETDQYISLPTTSNGRATGVLRIKTYDNIEDFIDTLIAQIPLEKRDKEALVKATSYFYHQTTEGPPFSPFEVDDPVDEDTSAKEFIVDENLHVTEKTTELPLVEDVTQLNNSIVSVHNIDLQTNTISTPLLMHLYCDLLEPHNVGDTILKSLRIVPLKNRDGKYIQFEHVQYNQISRGFFNNISIKITDNYGEQINFNNSFCPTFITLHFKRIAGKSI
jgi:hypothetical protein